MRNFAKKSMDKKIWLITGPTASGKTTLSLHLAEKLKCEIISADSRQIYNELTIGTAKPTPVQLAQTKHHFINHISIHDSYNAHQYSLEALSCIENLTTTYQDIVIVGGTGFYINALLSGLDPLSEATTEIKEKLNLELHQYGLEYLQAKLFAKDESTYYKIDIKNPRRLLRVLEIIEMTGKPFTQQIQTNSNKRLPYLINEIYLCPERNELYQRINQRVDEMMDNGLLDEVRQVNNYRTLPSLQTVGYVELFDYLDAKVTLDFAVDKIKQHTRNYAKRQITWFNKFSSGKKIESLDIAIEYFNNLVL